MVKKDNPKINLLILVIGLLIFVAAVFFLFFDKAKAPKNESKNDQQSQEKIPINPDTKIEATKKSTEDLTQVNLSTLKMPVLMYHYIRTVADQNDKLGIGLSVVPSKFASQLDKIQKDGYQTINFYDLEQNKIPSKPIILTFDDGYEDFYTTAYPELKKRNMTAVIYIIANNDGGAYMTASQIKELSDNGIEVGSHTLSHLDLSTANETKASNEISQSKTKLENIIGKTIISFCYPAGKYTEKTIEIVKNAGYKYATTTKPGLSVFSSPLELTRDRMNGDTNIESYIK